MKHLSLIFIFFFMSLTNIGAIETLPKDWQLGFSEPATELMSDVISFHSYILMPIITGISVLVLALLLYIVYRYNSNRNHTASMTTHNTLIEVLWTVIPVILLIIIAIPSFRILYTAETIPKADLTIKAIGNQWYWSYEYPDYDDFSFDANMLQDNELSDPSLRLLETDTQIVVPVNKVVKLLITSNDVLHAWTIPAFAVKKDAVPGRLNETWFKAEKIGTYYGQCSELCGIKHAFMPITVRVVSEQDYKEWLKGAKIKFAKEIIKENQFKKLASK